MLLEVLIGAALVAFGIMTIYFTIDQGVSDQKLMAILILGLLCTGAGIYVLVKELTLIGILKKISGFILAAAGLFFVLGFPDITTYQREGMGRAGIFLGIFLIIIGLWLLLF